MSHTHGRPCDSVEVTKAPDKSETALREEATQRFWEEHEIFNTSMEQPAGEDPVGDYVFYDGPPFATGTPHYGHILASAIKDAVPRFWTMNGYRVRRTWGWDCHGLPLENLIEKKLGLATKRDIEAYGIQNFNEAARDTVLEYADDWKRIIPRFGRFADMDDDYRTMDSSYTESVWWVFKTLHEKGLVYEGFKSMHLCPRCGTTLSNFEVNQGYKDIKDIAVTVKLPLLDGAGEPTDTSLLVWTTTPWTLPGNMAAAVHKEADYVKVAVETEGETEYLVLAKERAVHLGDVAYEVVEEMKGSKLVGKQYQPPFPYLVAQELEHKDKAWHIYHADYVELGDEGTGAVHLAPAYGEEDMELAKEHGVPIIHHVDEGGHFKEFVADFAGQLVKPKDDDEANVSHLDADIEIVRALKEKGLLLKKENITHSYPHCWRCDTPLLNYATTSWFVAVSSFRDELVAANQSVHWVPEHVGTNRFGKWLEGARDWAVSRQRYWGAPLPIWKNPESGEYKVFGSLADLQAYVPKSGNTYIAMRHAEAESNLTGMINADPSVANPLTDTGRTQCLATAAELKNMGIDMIIHTGMQRTRETAECVAAELGLDPSAVVSDERMIELQAGADLEGQAWKTYSELFDNPEDRFTKVVPGVENRVDVQKRVGAFLYEVEKTYHNQTILVIGHASSLFALEAVAGGWDTAEIIARQQAGFMQNAAYKTIPFIPLPHNDWYQLDYHRPYIDDIELVDTDGTKLERVPDVFDCWFESGSMPYGQHHYPFAAQEQFEQELFPANFIAEGLDQTRGWFYSLLVLGVALFGKSPYENVIVNGLVLAEDGKKMSKSLQNYPDPVELVDEVGADAVRFYMLSSGIMRAEDLNFSKKELLELQRKNIGRLHNVLAMYELYADESGAAAASSEHVLDQWIRARLYELLAESTAGYTNYELDRATRPLTDFIDDLSVWYVRRSRDRFKGADKTDAAAALGTLRYVLEQLSLIMAPAMPFYAEHVWQRVRDTSAAHSVHLAPWPQAVTPDQTVLEEMVAARAVVSAALEVRTKAKLRVRQPLSRLTIARTEAFAPAYEAIIRDEVNVKAIAYSADQELDVELDTTLTPELVAEGAMRELVRAVQNERKQLGLDPHDVVTLHVDTATAALLAPFEKTVCATVGARAIETVPAFASHEPVRVVVGEVTYQFMVLTE